MPHEFEVRESIELEASPEQVWEAIATGPGIDSWFMGRNEIEPGVGGKTRMAMGDMVQEATITTWEPGRRLAYRGTENPDGSFMAFEYLIEGRDQGSTVLRFVHSGFLGDDWEAEYDALKLGDAMYLRKLALYLKHFPGQISAYNMFLLGGPVADRERVWRSFHRMLGHTGPVTAGDKVEITVDGLPPASGVVEFVNQIFLGVRTADTIHMIGHGYRDMVVAEAHCFNPEVDRAAVERAWQSWLTREFA